MGRSSHKSMSLEERMKQNYIRDLFVFGITVGPNGESLQSMTNANLCRLVTRESAKQD